MNTPFLSLVIATVNRDAPLERCLASLVEQADDTVEIVIVDQNVDERVSAVVERYRHLLQITHVRHSTMGASSARNTGAWAARGTWIGFPDDDASFVPGSLRQFRLRADSEAYAVISGMTRDDAGNPSVLPWFTHECDITRHLLRRTVAESTLFVRRELFVACDGFDPLFGPGGAFCAEEAIDLVRRMQSQFPNVRMRFVPEVCLMHANCIPYRDEASLLKSKSYARGRGACFARHWRHASKRRILSEVSRHAVGALVFQGLRRKSRVDCLVGYVEGFRAYQRLNRLNSPNAVPHTSLPSPRH